VTGWVWKEYPMAYLPVNKDTLGKMRLRDPSSFLHLAQVSVCEIVATEIAAAAANYPVFFIEKEGGLVPVALFALRQNENLFVEENGAWTGQYIPALLRRYPFVIGRPDGDPAAEPVLMIDGDCGLLSETEGEPLFGQSNGDDMDTPVGRVIRLFFELEAQGQVTRDLMSRLAETDLLEPMSLALKTDQEEKVLEGVFSVNEQKLRELSDDAFLDLRRSDVLPLIYSHFLSLRHLNRLRERLNRREAMLVAGGQAPSFFLSD